MVTDENDKRIEVLRALVQEESGEGVMEHMAHTQEGNASSLVKALATLEAVFLVAAADGNLYRQEMDQISAIVAKLVNRQLPAEDLNRLVDLFAQDLDRDDYEIRARACAKAFEHEWSRRAVFVMAAGIALADGALQDEERDVLDLLAREFALKPEVVDRIIARAKDRMSETSVEIKTKTPTE